MSDERPEKTADDGMGFWFFLSKESGEYIWSL
jgi:hypothetical protein